MEKRHNKALTVSKDNGLETNEIIEHGIGRIF